MLLLMLTQQNKVSITRHHLGCSTIWVAPNPHGCFLHSCTWPHQSPCMCATHLFTQTHSVRSFMIVVDLIIKITIMNFTPRSCAPCSPLMSGNRGGPGSPCSRHSDGKPCEARQAGSRAEERMNQHRTGQAARRSFLHSWMATLTGTSIVPCLPAFQPHVTARGWVLTADEQQQLLSAGLSRSGAMAQAHSLRLLVST